MLVARLFVVAAISSTFGCSAVAPRESNASGHFGAQPAAVVADVLATCTRFAYGYNSFSETVDDALWNDVTGSALVDAPTGMLLRRLELPRRIAEQNASVLFVDDSIALVRVDEGPAQGAPTNVDAPEPMTFLISLRNHSTGGWKVHRFDEVTIQRRPRDEYAREEPDVAVLRSTLVGLIEMTGSQGFAKKWDFIFPGRQQLMESVELYRLVERSRTHHLISEQDPPSQSGSTMDVRPPRVVDISAERAAAIVSVDIAESWKSADALARGKSKSTTDYLVVWQRDFGGRWKVFLLASL